MKNFYNRFHKDVVREMREYFMTRAAANKRVGREYKSLEREVFLMTTRLLKPDTDVESCFGQVDMSDKEFDWQKRKDLQ